MKREINDRNIPEACRVTVDYEQNVQETQPALPDLPDFFGKSNEMVIV